MRLVSFCMAHHVVLEYENCRSNDFIGRGMAELEFRQIIRPFL